MISLSVTIITLNEARQIEATLRSVASFADEILVVDSFSSDETPEIARRHGARVLQRAFSGYGDQKAWATQQARFDWTLNLDADEVVDERLADAILAFKKNPGAGAAEVQRLTYYLGQPIYHGGWYPDRLVRLFDRRQGQWARQSIHESWIPGEGIKPVRLKGKLHHYSYHRISDHLRQIEHFSELNARAAVDRGKKAPLLLLLAAPAWTFFHTYFLRAGFLDGYYGYLIARFSAMATLAKYAKIREIRKRNLKKKP